MLSFVYRVGIIFGSLQLGEPSGHGLVYLGLQGAKNLSKESREYIIHVTSERTS